MRLAPTVSLRLALRLALPAVALTALLCSTGCKEEDTRLFDEAGVWALQKYALGGGVYTDITQIRQNVFLLNFSPGDGVVAAAGCFGTGNEGVDSSTCTVNQDNAFWECRCFAYEFDKSRMLWQEFTPGEEPPPVIEPGAGDTGGTDGGGASEAVEITVAETNASRTYEFMPLPEDLFNSDGQISKFEFVQRSSSVWEANDVNPEELQACAQSCFPSLRE